VKISQNDILEAIQSAVAPRKGEDGFTGPELMELTGYRREAIGRAIRTLVKDGRMEVVRLVRRRINGVEATILGYRLK